MPVSKGARLKKHKQQSTSGGERYVSLLFFLQLCVLVFSITAVLVLLLLDQDDGPSPARGRSAGAGEGEVGRREEEDGRPWTTPRVAGAGPGAACAGPAA